MKRITVGSEKFKNLVNRHEQGRKRLQKKVAGIIENVKADGDDALIWYTKKFDRVDLTRKDPR